MINFFHIKKNQPYNLCCKLLPTGALPKSFIRDMKELIQKYAHMSEDRSNLQDKWVTNDCENKFDKLLVCIRGILERNLREYRVFDFSLYDHLNFPSDESSFSVRTEERITKFMSRFQRMLELYFMTQPEKSNKRERKR